MSQKPFPISNPSPKPRRFDSQPGVTGLPNRPSPVSPGSTIRPRNFTSPPTFHRAAGSNFGVRPAQHRTSASDSFATVYGPNITPTEQSAKVSPSRPSSRPTSNTPREKGISNQNHKERFPRKPEDRKYQAEQLVNEQTRLQKEIDEETIRLSNIRQRRNAVREEMQRVELQKRERERLAHERLGGRMPYGSESTPALPDWTQYSRPRVNPSQDSFSSMSSEDSYNQGSKPPHGARSTESVPLSNYHWWKSEQTRKDAEREKIRRALEEVKERDRRAFTDAWAVYESRWMVLSYATRSSSFSSQLSVPSPSSALPTNLSLSFADIPWPLLHTPRIPAEITPSGIRSFLSSEYHSLGKTRRDRIREALLRWHPDRFGSRMLYHIREADRENVLEGVGIVVRSLNDLLASS